MFYDKKWNKTFTIDIKIASVLLKTNLKPKTSLSKTV